MRPCAFCRTASSDALSRRRIVLGVSAALRHDFIFIALIRPFDWHWSFKLAIMIGGSMLLLLASYHYLVRFTWIGAILNGCRHPRPAKSPRADAAAAG